MFRLIQDFRHATRACRRAPLVSALAIVAFLSITVYEVLGTAFSRPKGSLKTLSMLSTARLQVNCWT